MTTNSVTSMKLFSWAVLVAACLVMSTCHAQKPHSITSHSKKSKHPNACIEVFAFSNHSESTEYLDLRSPFYTNYSDALSGTGVPSGEVNSLWFLATDIGFAGFHFHATDSMITTAAFRGTFGNPIVRTPFGKIEIPNSKI